MTGVVLALPGASLDLAGGRVLRNGHAVKVEPRAWRVLELLARFRHRVVTKAELLAALRRDGEVSEAALRQAVRAARRAIGDDGTEPVIRAIPRVGYIFELPRQPDRPSAAASSAGDAAPALFVAPWRNETGRPHLQWVELGLSGAVAHGLALDSRLAVRGAPAPDLPTPQARAFVRRMMRGLGARCAVAGSLRRSADGFGLSLQIHAEDGESSVSLRGRSPAELAEPAVRAVQKLVAGLRRRGPNAPSLARCSPQAIELLAHACQAAAEHRHAAALRALELLNELEPGLPRLDLALLRARAVCGDEDAESFATTLLLGAQRDGDLEREAQVRQNLGSLHAARGALREAALSFRQSLDVGRGVMPADWQAHTLCLLASMECRLGEMHSVPSHLDEAQAIFQRIGNHHGLMHVLWVRAVMSSLSGNAAQAIAWNRRLAASARGFRAGTTLVSACINLAHDLLYADRLDEALAYAEESSATAQAIESSAELVRMIANVHCLIHRLRGRPDAAQALLAQQPHPADGDDEGYLWMAHGHAAMAGGRTDAAADCFQRAASEFRQRGNRIAEVPLLPWLVDALVRSGRLLLAQAELDRADAQPHLQDESTTANLLYARALLARRNRQDADAQRLLARLAVAPAALPLFKRLGQDLSATPAHARGVPSLTRAAPNGVMRRTYRFAGCVLDAERRELWVDGRRQTLAPKPFDVLVHLYRNRHRVVAQDELLDTVWDSAAGSPELAAQAITKVRRALRRSRTQPVQIQTVYGQGYRLLADAQPEPDDDTAAALLEDLQAPSGRPLAVLPWPDAMSSGSADRDLAYPLEVVAYALAVHARLHRMPAAELRAALGAAAAPADIAAAIRERSPGAHVLFARLARHDDALALDYVLVSPAGRTEGRLRDRSPTLLGRRLAARLLRLHADGPGARAGAAAEDPWSAQLIDLATRAAEEQRWRTALRALDVMLDHDPNHALAADLKARVGRAADAGRPAQRQGADPWAGAGTAAPQAAG